jgi:Peptidase A4 family
MGRRCCTGFAALAMVGASLVVASAPAVATGASVSYHSAASPRLPGSTRLTTSSRGSLSWIKSQHWAGYAATRTATDPAIPDVNSGFKVPTVNCRRTPDGSSSVWAGLGLGNDSDPLNQVGIDADCQNGKASYWAWYEQYDPTRKLPAVPLRDSGGNDLPVKPGDTILINLWNNNVDGEVWWTIWEFAPPAMHETDMRWMRDGIFAATTSPMSAECIVERLSQKDSAGNIRQDKLADFGLVTFAPNLVGGNWGSACSVGSGTNAPDDPTWEIARTQANMSPWSVYAMQIFAYFFGSSTNRLLGSVSRPSADGSFTVHWKGAK